MELCQVAGVSRAGYYRFQPRVQASEADMVLRCAGLRRCAAAVVEGRVTLQPSQQLVQVPYGVGQRMVGERQRDDGSTGWRDAGRQFVYALFGVGRRTRAAERRHVQLGEWLYLSGVRPACPHCRRRHHRQLGRCDLQRRGGEFDNHRDRQHCLRQRRHVCDQLRQRHDDHRGRLR